MDKFALFIFNVFLNSLLAFFTATILIEVAIFLFRIRRGRWASFLRMIPILKLPFDLFYYDFARWSYAQGVNPLTCPEGSRTLSVMLGWFGRCPSVTSGIQFTAPGDLTFTIADVISNFFNLSYLVIFSFLLIGCSLSLFLRKIFLYFRFNQSLDALDENNTFEQRKIRNSKISRLLRRKGISIATISNIKGSPFVAGLTSKVIYMPSSFGKKLSRKEYEAVLAHEAEHIRRKDILIRFILDLVGAIFWWVPTQGLRKRVEEGQEVACDLYAEKYGVVSTDLASAICKSAKEAIRFSSSQGVQHLSKHIIQKRVSLLLHPSKKQFRRLYFCWAFVIAILSISTIFLGRFWIF